MIYNPIRLGNTLFQGQMIIRKANCMIAIVTNAFNFMIAKGTRFSPRGLKHMIVIVKPLTVKPLKSHLSRELNCWSLRCSRSIACWRCYIIMLDSTLGFNRLGKDNCKTRRETFKFWDLVRLILEVWRYSVMLVLNYRNEYNSSDLIMISFFQPNLQLFFIVWFAYTRKYSAVKLH